MPRPAGVRAQALHRDGSWSTTSPSPARTGQVHVLNAPSPAATAALEIGRHIVDEIELEGP